MVRSIPSREQTACSIPYSGIKLQLDLNFGILVLYRHNVKGKKDVDVKNKNKMGFEGRSITGKYTVQWSERSFIEKRILVRLPAGSEALQSLKLIEQQ